MEMSGAAKFTAGGIFPKSNSPPSQGQACVHQELQPEGEPGRRSGSAPHVAAGRAGGGGGRRPWPGCAHPEPMRWGGELGRFQPSR